MIEQTITQLRHAYAALAGGDVDEALAMLAPDCEWHESEELPGAGVLRGRDAVARFLDDFLQSWQRFEQDIEEVIPQGNRIALVIHLKAIGRGSGIELDTRYAHVWTIRDGLGVRVDAYRDPEDARRALPESNPPAAPSASESVQKPA